MNTACLNKHAAITCFITATSSDFPSSVRDGKGHLLVEKEVTQEQQFVQNETAENFCTCHFPCSLNSLH